MNMKRKVLVVDNDDVVREVLVELIRIIRPDWDVLEAADGETGVSMVTANRPDVVLVDLNMPIMDGDVMIRQLQTQPATEHIPYVLLTGEYESSARMRQIGQLCFSVLQKPYTFDQLENLFNRIDQLGVTG